MPYTIGEVARMMNIAPSTLRYYEKEGLLSLGVRASNGQRTYTDDDIATLSIIEYLKFCGLPLKEIRSFLPLIRPGGETLSARRDILAKERDNVRAQIAALQTKLERLEFSCVLDAAGHHKKLEDYFVNEKIPASHRDEQLLLAGEDEIFWIVGGRMAYGTGISDATRWVLEITASNSSH